MNQDSLVSKIHQLYSEEGILCLLISSWRYGRRKIKLAYIFIIELLCPKIQQEVTLNGVTVPVEVTKYHSYIPFYANPYPIDDNTEYENTEVEAIRKYVEPDDNVVIIGGGLGVTAVMAANQTCGTIIAYEQSKETYHTLNETIGRNGKDGQIETVCAAIGKVASSNFTFETPDAAAIIQPEAVPDADVYELDCEGAETEILPKMVTRPRVVLVETHDNHLDVVEILTELGYTIEETVKDGQRQHPTCTHVRAVYSDK